MVVPESGPLRGAQVVGQSSAKFRWSRSVGRVIWLRKKAHLATQYSWVEGQGSHKDGTLTGGGGFTTLAALRSSWERGSRGVQKCLPFVMQLTNALAEKIDFDGSFDVRPMSDAEHNSRCRKNHPCLHRNIPQERTMHEEIIRASDYEIKQVSKHAKGLSVATAVNLIKRVGWTRTPADSNETAVSCRQFRVSNIHS